MKQIKTGKVKMKPRWYFVVGSLASITGLFGILILSTFLVSLISFTLRTHGPMGSIRYQQLVDSFPWWSLPIIFIGLGVGVSLLRQYDFSYKKNFGVIIISILATIIIGGILIDYTGLSSVWMQRGPMRRMYQQHIDQRQPGWRWQP